MNGSRRVAEIIKESLAVEYEDAKSAGMLGYMARAMVQATLPHSDPKTHYFERTNGLVTLSVTSRPKVGVPYGSIPRILMAWICTEAVRTQNPELSLGRSQNEFLVKLKMQKDGRAIGRLKDQAHRLFSSLISLTSESEGQIGLENVVIARRALLFWNPRKPNERSLWESSLLLNDSFYNEVIDAPVPIDMRALHALSKSPMAMDIYTWLGYRVFLLQAKGRPSAFIPWEALRNQFGAGYGGRYQLESKEASALTKEAKAEAERNFRRRFMQRTQEVLAFYPEARGSVIATPTGLLVKSCRLHIAQDAPSRPARPRRKQLAS